MIEDRGIELVIDVFKSLEGTTNHVVFIGFGSLTEYVKENASMVKNIHFRDAMKKDELYDFFNSADLSCATSDSYKHLTQPTNREV